MTHLDKVELTLNHFNNGNTVVLMTHKQTELYNAALHSEGILLKALQSAIIVRLV